jgi:hypothetical protein
MLERNEPARLLRRKIIATETLVEKCHLCRGVAVRCSVVESPGYVEIAQDEAMQITTVV